MNGTFIIVNMGILDDERVDGMMRIAYICYIMKEGSTAVHRFEMRDIILLNPNGIACFDRVIDESELQYILGMLIADGYRELANIRTPVI